MESCSISILHSDSSTLYLLFVYVAYISNKFTISDFFPGKMKILYLRKLSYQLMESKNEKMYRQKYLHGQVKKYLDKNVTLISSNFSKYNCM